MKCPYCDKEMIAGYIQSSGHIYWSENIRKVVGIPPRKNGMCISDNTGMGSIWQKQVVVRSAGRLLWIYNYK